MKLQQIIDAMDNNQSVLVENIIPRKKQLTIYFKNVYDTDDLILLITDVFNAAQYAFIVPADECYIKIKEYLGKEYSEDQEELILFQSMALASL